MTPKERGKKKTIKDVTNHKKKETIMPLSEDETDILYPLHLQYHRLFFFYHKVDLYRDPSVGLQCDSMPEHAVQMRQTGRSDA